VRSTADCARCEDDSKVNRPEARPRAARDAKRCAVCGQPASFQLNGKWYCVKHYLEVVKNVRV
jgi:hypothetical protein